MTWLDWMAILSLFVCGAVGARLGSLWIGVCLAGGFLGASLADTYSFAAAEYLGSFSGAHLVAWILIFLAGLAVILILGFLISRFGSVLITGVIDSAIGLLAGLFCGILGLTLALFLLFPLYPKMERKPFWKNSSVVRPGYQAVESLFEKKLLKNKKFNIKKEFKNSLENLKSLSPVK